MLLSVSALLTIPKSLFGWFLNYNFKIFFLFLVTHNSTQFSRAGQPVLRLETYKQTKTVGRDSDEVTETHGKAQLAHCLLSLLFLKKNPISK